MVVCPPCRGEAKGGNPADEGDTTEPWGLVGDWNPDCAKLPGGDPAPHRSTCSGLMEVLMGLEGSCALPGGGFCSCGGGGWGAEGAGGGGGGGVVGSVLGGILSTGVEEVVSEAQDCGELAVVEPGDEAVAWVESPPLSPEPEAFSAFRHFARRFWNQTCISGEIKMKE